ncbi:hypothetical protein HQ520_18335 [bacterium]|nr:hypothetical protein [bacterium]
MSDITSRTLHSTPHFALTASGVGRPDLAKWGEKCEKAFAEISRRLSMTFPIDRKIWVHLSTSSKDFSDFLPNRRGQAFAMPKFSRIVVDLSESRNERGFSLIMGHELVHVFLGRIPIETGAIPLWLHEGLAQAIADHSRFGNALAVSVAWVGRVRIPLDQLNTSLVGGYGQFRTHLAYARSLSFTRYLSREVYDFPDEAALLRALLEDPERSAQILGELRSPAMLAEYESGWVEFAGNRLKARIALLVEGLIGLIGIIVWLRYLARKRLKPLPAEARIR